MIVAITPSFIRIRWISRGLARRPLRTSSRTVQGNWSVTRSLRGAAVLAPVRRRRDAAGEPSAAAVLRRRRVVALRRRCELPLLAAAEHRAIFVAFRPAPSPLPRRCLPLPRRCLFVVDRQRRGAPGVAALARPALLLFLFERAFVAPQMRGQRLAALLAGAEHVGRQPHVGLLRGRLVVGRLVARLARLGHRREFDGGPSPLAGAAPSAFLRSADFAFRADDRHFAGRGARADVLLAAHGAGQRAGAARRSVATAVSTAVDVAANVRFRLGSSSSAGSADFGRAVGAGGFGVTITGILPVAPARSAAAALRGAAFAGFALAVPPPLRNCLTLSTSSSVRLASADPLPGTPAFVQMSTSSLLSSFSSFANA